MTPTSTRQPGCDPPAKDDCGTAAEADAVQVGEFRRLAWASPYSSFVRPSLGPTPDSLSRLS
jgi:hypothetical protein